MASISTSSKDLRTLYIVFGGKRRAIYLGPIGKKPADEIARHAQRLADALSAGDEPPTDTAEWLKKIDDKLHAKLCKNGLATPRGKTIIPTLGEFLDAVIASRPAMKPNTRKNWLQTKKSLIGFFGADRQLSDINAADADDWKADQEGKGYATATISRNVKRGKQFFAVAVKRGYLKKNPLQGLKAVAQVNKTREFFVSREAIDKALQHCPDAEWQLIILLARYGGVRVPSELFPLRWGDVDWEGNKLRITSPKTAHCPGGASRIIPIFPELKKPLQDAYHAAEEGQTYIIAKHRLGGENLRTQLGRILDKAGIAHWPRLWQNMRASRETELCQSHPLHVVTAWIGNSAVIASKHYLQVTDADYANASQGGPVSDQPPETMHKTMHGRCTKRCSTGETPSGNAGQEMKKAPENKGFVLETAQPCPAGQMDLVPPRGVEPLFSD